MIVLNTNALDALRTLVTEAPASEIAARLLGPEWKTSIRSPQDGSYRVATFPKPYDVAEFLGPLVTGRIYFDQRSTRASRIAGWWTPDGSGFRETSLAEIVHALLLAARDLLSAARARPVGPRFPASDHARTVAVISSLERLLASGDRVTNGIATVWRGMPEFALPRTARRALVASWLASATRADAWTDVARPGPADGFARVSPAALVRRYRDDGGSLRSDDFLDAIDALLGARSKVNGLWSYRVPVAEVAE